MDRASIEVQVKAVVAEMAKLPEAQVDPAQWVTRYNIDSLQLLVLRETLESALQVRFTDNDWLGFGSIAAVVDHVSVRKAGGRAANHKPPSEPIRQASAAKDGGGTRYTPSGLLYSDVEIGMPLTGRNNLAEGPLLQLLGDLRWNHMSHLCGAVSKEIVDAEGHRLYPTFFYVEMAFPQRRPLASFGENDRLKAVSDLRRFGGSMLDGTFFLLPDGADEPDALPFESAARALAAGVPSVRLSNIFVMMFSGAEWLKKSRPANPGFERIPQMSAAPDSYAVVKEAEKAGSFFGRPAGFIPMTAGAVQKEYKIVPDRDLNGAGLIYFANYPVFLDICEREVLAGADLALTEELIDSRTLVRRKSAYLNNASARDVLSVEIESYLEDPFAHGPAAEAPIRLLMNYRMRRKSDGRLMMVSSAEKVISGRTIQEAPFFSRLAGRDMLR